jgi:hypothetical protein
MKRALFLLALVTLVVWMAQGAPPSDPTEPGKATPGLKEAVPSAALNPVAPQNSCCPNSNEFDPHWECFDGSCYLVEGCGPNVNCAFCGCSATEEFACISNGGYWDSYYCTCDYGCDPYGSQQQACVNGGGYWDAYNCICNYPCDPTGAQQHACENAGRVWSSISCTCGNSTVRVCEEAQLIDYQEYYYNYCDGYTIQYCTESYYFYQQYCLSPAGYRYWTDSSLNCYSFGDPCGGGDGGCCGGGGDCWDTGDCWCDWDWGICCEYDDCYWWEEWMQ